jgi:hypothetical protein
MSIELTKIFELDLEHQSLHVAANTVAATMLGGQCCARIVPARDVSDPMDHVTVVRHFEVEGCLTARELAIVALAGEIVVTVRDHMLDSDGEFPTARDLYHDGVLEPDDFFQSSRERIGGYLPEGFDDPGLFDLLEEALQILVENWKLIPKVAEAMSQRFRERFDPASLAANDGFVESGCAETEADWADVTALIAELEELGGSKPNGK